MEVLKNLYFALKNALQNFIKDKNFLFLSILFFTFLVMYWGRFGDPVIDCGREAYIPYAMADLGKVLFKDIICIYGPVPYYLNAFFVKLFGANLNTMYIIGAALSLIFLFGFYKFSKRFIGPGLAFALSGITIACCIFNPTIFNYIFPYSYAMLYSLVFALFHLIYLFKFIDEIESLENSSLLSLRNLYTSAFLLSLCLLSKFDFIPCVLPFLIVLFKYRKMLNLKAFLHIVAVFLIPFLILFLIFLIQKVTLQDLMFNFKMISNMAHSPSLEYFYKFCTGYFFSFKKTFMFIIPFLISVICLAIAGFLGYFASKIKNKFLQICMQIIISVIFGYIIWAFTLKYVFTYYPLFVLIFFILQCFILLFKWYKTKGLVLEKEEFLILLFILTTLLFSLKCLYGLFYSVYGTYYIPFILLSSIIAFLIVFEKQKNAVTIGLKTSLFIIIAIFTIHNHFVFDYKTAPLKITQGKFFTQKSVAYSMNNAMQYLNKKLQKNDTVLALPEGLMVNYLLKKPSPFYNTSFTPLDFDAYGEDYLVKKLLLNRPKYIVMLSRRYADYDKTFLCADFGQKFCSVVGQNYAFDFQFVGKGEESFAGREQDMYLIRVFERKN